MLDNSVQAYLDDYDAITVVIDDSFYGGLSDHFWLLDDGDGITELKVISHEVTRHHGIYKLLVPQPPVIGIGYQLMVDNGHFTPLQYRFIVKTPRFAAEFYYDGDDLGAIYGRQATRFSLWAPTADEVLLQTGLGTAGDCQQMKRTAAGVWRLEKEGDLDRMPYVYLVHVNGQWQQALDPYAKAALANGKASAVAALGPRSSSTACTAAPLAPHQAVIYETSVRDASDGATFISMIDQVDRMAALGVTHVQLMPVTSFSTVDELHPRLAYNWGYDPRLPQVLEGAYSTDVHDPCRVMADLARLVDACHAKGLRVCLDMVFNHVYAAAGSCFSQTVPYYYFRYDHNQLSNGSLCGNDFDSTMAMARRYIIDTALYLTRQYGIDGFRLDLMGVLDVVTVDSLAQHLALAKPGMMLYGEGWNMPTPLAADQKADIDNRDKMPHVGLFNDQFRDALKGSTFDMAAGGYASGDPGQVAAAQAALGGMRFDDPDRSINYVECHDNATLYDKLQACCPSETEPQIVARHKMICACLAFAQGVVFIHNGQEFCRTKHGRTNTYNAGDKINHLDAGRMRQYAAVTRYVADVLAIRRATGLAKDRQGVLDDVAFQLEGQVLIMHVSHAAGGRMVSVIVNPLESPFIYRFADGRTQLADQDGACRRRIADSCTVAPLSVAVLETL